MNKFLILILSLIISSCESTPEPEIDYYSLYSAYDCPFLGREHYILEYKLKEESKSRQILDTVSSLKRAPFKSQMNHTEAHYLYRLGIINEMAARKHCKAN